MISAVSRAFKNRFGSFVASLLNNLPYEFGMVEVFRLLEFGIYTSSRRRARSD